MANWSNLKTAIASVIKTNGNQEITGGILQNTLNSIVNSVGENATFAGIATPSTNPGTPDGPVFYLAYEPGTYSNFGGIVFSSYHLSVVYNSAGTWQYSKVYECLQDLGESVQYPISQKAVSDAIDSINNTISDMFPHERVAVNEEVLFTSNDEVDTYLKVNENGVYAKDFFYISGNPLIGVQNYKNRAVYKIKTGAWDSISTTNGYSTHYGKYLNSDKAFKNTAGIVCYIYKVTPGETIHVRGVFTNGIYVTGYFADEELTDFISFGSKKGSASVEYLDYDEQVPEGAYYCVLNRSSVDFEYDLVRLVEKAEEPEKVHKIVLYGMSLVQMEGFADKLLELVKAEYPQYDVFNYGIGGEKSVDIMARAGIIKMILEPSDEYLLTDINTEQKYFVLPANTDSVAIGANCVKNSWDGEPLSLLLQNTATYETLFRNVYVDGILCKLSRQNNTYYLNRINAGDEEHRIYFGTEIINANNVRLDEDDIAVIDIDVNGGWSTAAEAVEQVRVFANNIGTNKIIVLSGGYLDDSGTGKNTRSVVLERESLYSKYFGEKYFNIREYLCNSGVNDALSSGLWNKGTYPTDTIDASIPHPNTEDLKYLKSGKFAPMYFVMPNPNSSGTYPDIIHYSRRTYVLKDTKLFLKMKELNYFK